MVIAVSLVSIQQASAVTDVPLPVTPYGGTTPAYSPTLTRAPYVTDLTQTTAYVNWATSSGTPGSLQVSPMGTSGCPASTTTWSTTSKPLPVPTKIPYQTSTSTSPVSWSFTVVNGAGTTITEYQASVLVPGLSPGTPYCYAVFSTDKAGAVDLLPPSTNPALLSLRVQSFTTLATPNASSTAPVKFDVIDDTGENYEATTQSGAPSDVPFNSTGTPVNPDEASLYQQIGQSGAQFLLDAGDTGYNNGSQTNLGDLEETGTTTDVSNFFGPSYYPLTGGIPTFSASGDHNQNNTALKVFPTPISASNPGESYAYDTVTNVDGITGSAPADWYAFSTRNVRIYIIDAAWGESATSGKLGTTTGSLCGTAGTSAATACQPYEADNAEHWQSGSAEYQWLASDLSNPANAGMIKLAVFHFPLRSDNSSQPSDLYAQNSSANPHASTSLEALLAKNGVAIAFDGHAHDYQRTIPDGPGQIVNYVTGGGGGVLEPVQGTGTTTCQNLLATSNTYAIGWSPTKTGTGSYCGPAVGSAAIAAATPQSIADVYSYLQVTVTGDQVNVTPYNAAGKSFDPYTYTFNPGGSAPPVPSTPANVIATATSSSTVQLTWSPSTESGGTIASYQISRNGSALTSVPATATSYTDTSVQPSTAYAYTVTAADSNNVDSSAGSSNQVTTPATTGTSPALVQIANGGTESAASATLVSTFAFPTASGHLLVLSASVYEGASNHILSVTDSAGNTWVRATSNYVPSHFSDGEIWYSANAKPAATVTLTLATAASVADEVEEFSGVSGPLDVASSVANTGTTATSPSAASSEAGELAVGFVAGHASTQAIAVSSAGYRPQNQQISTGGTSSTEVSVRTGFDVLSGAGSQTFSGTFTSAMYWTAGIAIFKPS